MNQNQIRPDRVNTAIKLLYSSLGVGVVRSLLEAPALIKQGASLGFVVFVSVFVLAFLSFFIHKIGKGRNWARITFLVMFILGIPISISPMIQSLMNNPVSGMLGLAQLVVQIIAIVFLFQKTASNWFKTIKKNKKSNQSSEPILDTPSD